MVHRVKPTKMHQISYNYFKLNFFVLKVFGIAVKPIENSIKGILYKIYSIFLLLICYIAYPVSEVVYLINEGDLEDSTFVLCYLLTQTVGFLKVALVMTFKKKIVALCKSLEAEPFLPDRNRGGDIEFTYIKDAIRTSNNQGYLFHFFVVIIISQRYIYAVRDPGYYKSFFDLSSNTTTSKHVRVTPFYCVLPFQQIDSPYYEITTFYQITSAAIFGFVIGAVDGIICGIMCHIKAQLLILNNYSKTYFQRANYLVQQQEIHRNVSKFKEMKQFNNNVVEIQKIPKILQKYVDICVADLIKHHQKTIELAEGAENTFSLLMLAQFFLSLLLICFSLFQISIYKIPSVKFFSMFCYLALMVFQLALYCWCGNEIMLRSYAINDAIFESDWILMDVKTQKSLLLMMMRTSKPIKMTAGKFAFLSLTSFMSIVRGSGSYFMVLRNMSAAED